MRLDEHQTPGSGANPCGDDRNIACGTAWRQFGPCDARYFLADAENEASHIELLGFVRVGGGVVTTSCVARCVIAEDSRVAWAGEQAAAPAGYPHVELAPRPAPADDGAP